MPVATLDQVIDEAIHVKLLTAREADERHEQQASCKQWRGRFGNGAQGRETT
jgi:hypothetical protein